jgi:hypothetical protein
MWEAMDLVSPVVPILAKAVKAAGATQIVDLCSGGGGPHRLLLPQLQAATGNKELGMTLTDLWPHVDAWNEVCVCMKGGGVDGQAVMWRQQLFTCRPRSLLGYPSMVSSIESYTYIRTYKQLTAGVPGLRFEPNSVDATAVPPQMKGFRALFGCLHHFPPELVKGMIADAVAKGEGVGVFEGTSRDTLSILIMAVLAPLSAWLFPLLRRPFRLDYLLWGTLLPVGALLNTHDALVSCLRTYSPAEMQAIVESVKGHETYDWEYGMRPPTGSGLLAIIAKVPYLVGIPKTSSKKGK